MLFALHGQSSRQFEDFTMLENEMQVVSLFSCCVDDTPSEVQFELIDLQSNALLQDHFKKMSLLHFYSALDEENFVNLRRHAQKKLVLFGSTYTCEQAFSVMKLKISTYRSNLTDDRLSAILFITTSDIQPNLVHFSKPRVD